MFGFSLLLATGVFAIDTPPLHPHQPCSARVQHAQGSEPAKVRKLNEMPPANQVLTVLRSEDGCPKPVVVRRDIGSR